jgi:fatty-acyl-CoA synthase
MARQDAAGYVYIVDRKKDMIISGGFNVFPREIEDVLATHPGVSASVAIGVPDERWGEAVKVVVVPRPGARPDADELIALVRDKKGVAYAPKSIEFADDLPVTAIGKPDRKAVRSRFWHGQERQVH